MSLSSSTSFNGTSVNPGTTWTLPDVEAPIVEGPGRTPVDIATRRELAARVAEQGENNGWSKAEVARRIGMPDGTFNQWFKGNYQGRFDGHNEKVANWLASVEEIEALAAAIPVSPPFIRTRISDEITDMLASAQMMPTIIMATCEAGMGKTTTAKRFASVTGNVYLATISPHTKTVHGMLSEIAEALDVMQPNASKLVRSIGKRLERRGAGTLLIIDECQNLVDDAINQLRHFTDNYGCGIALLGNTETYSRFNRWSDGPKYGQLRRRIFKRIRRDRPTQEDLHLFIRAWGVTEPEMVQFLTGVGVKPGAFGQVDMTIKLARLTAQGANRPMTLADLKAAWSNRDVGVGE